MERNPVTHRGRRTGFVGKRSERVPIDPSLSLPALPYDAVEAAHCYCHGPAAASTSAFTLQSRASGVGGGWRGGVEYVKTCRQEATLPQPSILKLTLNAAALATRRQTDLKSLLFRRCCLLLQDLCKSCARGRCRMLRGDSETSRSSLDGCIQNV